MDANLYLDVQKSITSARHQVITTKLDKLSNHTESSGAEIQGNTGTIPLKKMKTFQTRFKKMRMTMTIKMKVNMKKINSHLSMKTKMAKIQ